MYVELLAQSTINVFYGHLTHLCTIRNEFSQWCD